MSGALDGKRFAFLVANEGIEQAELTEPWKAIKEAGGTPELVATEAGEVQAFEHLDQADTFPVDRTTADAQRRSLRRSRAARWRRERRRDPHRRGRGSARREIVDANLPIAVICHGPWILAEADVLRGRTLTSWPSLQTDLRNAGASGWTKRCTSTAGWSAAASPTTSRRSARSSSRVRGGSAARRRPSRRAARRSEREERTWESSRMPARKRWPRRRSAPRTAIDTVKDKLAEPDPQGRAEPAVGQAAARSVLVVVRRPPLTAPRLAQHPEQPPLLGEQPLGVARRLLGPELGQGSLDVEVDDVGVHVGVAGDGRRVAELAGDHLDRGRGLAPRRRRRRSAARGPRARWRRAACRSRCGSPWR